MAAFLMLYLIFINVKINVVCAVVSGYNGNK